MIADKSIEEFSPLNLNKKTISEDSVSSGSHLETDNFTSQLIKELTNEKEIICLFDVNGKILLMNQYGKRFLHGKPNEDGHYYIQENFLAPDVKHEFNIYLSLALKEKRTRDFIKVLNKSKKERIIEVDVELKNFEEHTFLKGIGYDVTRIWKKYKNVNNENKYYKKIFNNSSAVILILNKEKTIIDINRSALKELGLKKDDIIGKDLRFFAKIQGIYWEYLNNAFEYSWTHYPTGDWDGQYLNDKEITKEIVLKRSTYEHQDVVIYIERNTLTNDFNLLNRNSGVALNDPIEKYEPGSGKMNTSGLKKFINEIVKSISSTKNIDSILEKALLKTTSLLGIKSAGILYLSDNKKSYSLRHDINIPGQVRKEIQQLKYGGKSLKNLFKDSNQVEIKNLKDLLPQTELDEKVLFAPIEINNDLEVIYFFFIDNLHNEDILVLNFSIKEINNYILKLALTNQLIQSEIKYKTLFESSGEGVVLMNENGFLDCNQKSLEVFKCNKEDFLSAYIKEFFPHKVDKIEGLEFTAFLKEALLGKPQFFTWHTRTFDNTYFYSEVSLTRIEIDNQCFALAFIRDISEKKKAEKEIREKDILFKTLADNALVLLRMTDSNSLFYYFNKPWLDFTGRKLEEEQNNGWISLVHPDDLKNTIDTIFSAIKSKRRFEISYRLKRYDGVYRWILDKGTPYKDHEDNFLGYISSAIDITERKIAEEELRKEEAAHESLNKLQNALSGAHLLAFTINTNGVITFCNKFLLKTTSFERNELLGKNIFEFLIFEKDILKNKIDFIQIIESWTLSENNEAVIRTKENQYISIRFSSTIITNSKGQIVGLTIVAEDITERKKVVQELEESEEKFRNIYESFQDLYFQCDLNGIIKMVSPSVMELAGYSEEDVLNKNITDYYLYSKKTKDLIKQLLEKGRVRNFEASLINKEGKIIQFICNVRLLYNKKGKPSAIEGVARDITEIKKATEELVVAKEVAEKSLAVKERFLANMSHEIRTPMNGIIGMIDLVSGTPLNLEQKDYVQTIKKSSETLLNILNDILDLSKIEAGKMELRESPIKLDVLLEKIYALFSQQAYAKNLTLYYYYDKGLPEYVSADETRLLQILSNLTSNAIKFTEGGGSVNIGIRKAGEMENGRILVRVDVKDSGIGISKEHQKLLFNSFTQVDNSTTKNYGGTGLGLVISKELAKLMNGNIGVYSTLGLGSTFWFTFETEAAEKPLESSISIKKDKFVEVNQFRSKTPYLLLVDDNSINQKVASEILIKSGCKVDLANNGLQAIEKVKTHQYDLIFMDIQMPEMDGVTATAEIRKLNIEKIPPIVAMTAYSMKEDREKFLSVGMDDYIAKPIKANVLVDKVKEWFLGDSLSTAEEEINANTEEPINSEVIQQLLKYGDQEMLEKIYSDFVIETEGHISDCVNSLITNDFKNILSNLHTLKGNAGTLGIEKLANFAKLLENNVKQGLNENLEEEFNQLKKIFTEFEQSYKQFLTKSL